MTNVLVVENWADRGCDIVRLLREAGYSVSLVRPYAQEPLPPAGLFRLVVLSGGPMSVNDASRPDYAFIGTVIKYAGQLVTRSIPCLGICLGHQILATVLGGRVEPMGYQEVGIRSIQVVEDACRPRRRFRSFVFHKDHVVDTPPGCVLTFTSDGCAVEGFRHLVQPVHGVQFHPEIPRARAVDLLDRLRSKGDGHMVVGSPASFDDREAHTEFHNLICKLLTHGESA